MRQEDLTMNLPENNTCFNGTAAGPINNDDLNALLYIVVTLLFYSMGIIIGIITYLKREQAEMEEDKVFEMYLQLKREPFNLHKKERVNQMALYLKQLEERREARERVENWRTAEVHHLPNQSQLGQTQHLPSCPHHSSYLAGADLWVPPGNSAAPPGASESEWAESGGGPALLCSLTLGVCEPLLTPETVKRVAFPDVPCQEIDTKGVGFFSMAPVRCHCGAIKSAIKSNSPVKLSSAIKKATISAQMVCPNQCPDVSAGHPQSFYSDTNNTVTSHQCCDIKLENLPASDEPSAVFHRSAPFFTSLQAVKSSYVSSVHRSLSFTEPLNSRLGMSRKLSLDLESRLTELDIHSSGQTILQVKDETEDKSQHRGDKSSGIDKNFLEKPAEVVSSHHENPQTAKNATQSPKTNGGLPAAPLLWADVSPQQQTIVYSIPLPESTISSVEPLKSPPIQLALFITPTPLDVRPKIFPLQDIPKSQSMDGSVDLPASEGSPAVSKRRLHNPKYDSWKRGNHRTVDIPDLSRSPASHESLSKIAVHQGNKSSSKGQQPLRDNERRGALFFTQKSLHTKESDGIKNSSAQRPGRLVGALGRQESVDSSYSRNSELSDSPLLQTGAPPEGLEALNMSSASSSADSAPTSPPAVGRHQGGRIPRLVRSYTEETSKLLRK